VTDLLIHIVVLLVLPPLMFGVIGKVKALFAGRVGAPLFQPYYDLFKLFRKRVITSTATTWIFSTGPGVTLVTVCIAGLLVPFGHIPSPVSFTGDVILFAYLFGLARFFTAGAALDTGSAFEGMGAARDVSFSVLAEPALFIAFLVLARISGSLSVNGMVQGFTTGFSPETIAPVILISLGLFVILLTETCRIPVDDPATHLELTMIHEVMVLDHSGPLLGVILYSSAMKLFVLGAFLLNIAVPFSTGNSWLDWAVFIAEMVALSGIIGVIESTMARLRMNRVPVLLVSAVLLCGFAFILLVR